MNGYYEILPEDTFKIIRNCGKCGCKMSFKSTNKFRVNANGNRLDVWLIYQCEKCKHTYNLPIYERVNPSSLDPTEYALFLKNDEQLAKRYANDRALLERNHCVIDPKTADYKLSKQAGGTQEGIIIDNPYGMKVRVDKLIAEILGLSRSKVKRMMDEEHIQYFLSNKKEYVISYDEKCIFC